MMQSLFTQQAGRTLPRLLGLVALGTGLAVLLLAAYLYWNSLQASLALARAADDVKAQAQQIENQVQAIRDAMTSEAFATVAGQVAAGQAERNQLTAVLRSRGVRNVLNVIVATEAIEAIDMSAFPGSGFAALEMMLRARGEGHAPFQAHFAGTPDEYLAVAERLGGQASGAAVALVTLPVSVLANQITLPETVDSMQLVQNSAGLINVLQEFGNPRVRGDSSLGIDGTLFELRWNRSTVIGPMTSMQLFGVMGVGVLTALLGLLLIRRSSGTPEAPKIIDEPRPQSRPQPEPEPEPVAAAKPAVATEDRAAPREFRQEPAASAFGQDESDQNESLTSDGELRRPVADQQNIDAPELGGRLEESSSRQQETTVPEDEDDLFFDPDAPADDQSEISQMLQSLVEDEGRSSAQAPAHEPADQPEAGAQHAKPIEPAAMVLPPRSIFRAYDIRGIVGDTLSKEIAESIGRAIGAEARHRGLNRIAIARDGRLSGAELLAALARGLVASGLEVIDVGAVPTPVLYYAAQELGGGSGVMVTGSHNPPDYNGFKIVLGGETLSGDSITALHQRLESGDLAEGQGQVYERRIAVQYVERIGTDIQLERPLKVVADCGNGIAGSIAPRLLEAIGADVIPLYAEVDGTFPNHHPDPSDPKTLEDLKLCVRNFNADIGVAFDGDGDRLGVVAANGEIIYADRLMMLFARDVLSRNPGAPIIFDVKCSSLLAPEIEKAGGKPIMGRTGHSYMKQQLKREQAPLAGEMSGHFFFAERWFGFDDGMYAAARLLEILAADTRAVGQILASLPKAESTPELKVEMKEGEPHPFVEEFQRSAQFEDAEINTIDGLRADFKDGFGLVRASNTTPVLVLRFEGQDKKALARIQEQFRKAMLEVNPTLKLPF
ncbi:MAG: phosphomannomutase/phosphoglucomutase [Wenzhouxiangellaceae bacterium]|nr:phosphomannomutase/phosphoglucomutase [Wenzhouxiangellaceae bacterium]